MRPQINDPCFFRWAHRSNHFPMNTHRIFELEKSFWPIVSSLAILFGPPSTFSSTVSVQIIALTAHKCWKPKYLLQKTAMQNLRKSFATDTVCCFCSCCSRMDFYSISNSSNPISAEVSRNQPPISNGYWMISSGKRGKFFVICFFLMRFMSRIREKNTIAWKI